MWMIYLWFSLINLQAITGTTCPHKNIDSPVQQLIYICKNVDFSGSPLVPEWAPITYKDYQNVLEIQNTSIQVLKYYSNIFSRFGNFTVVNISYAGIREIQENAFTDMKSIETLYLSNNEISTVVSTIFDSLEVLKHLSLSNNLISDIAENGFSRAKQLLTLNLSSNSLYTLRPFSTYGLEKVETMDVSHNYLSILDLNDINNSLKVLMLNHNEIKRIIARRNGTDSVYLANLSLSNNNIEDLQRDSFNDLEFLKNLDLSSNNLGSLHKELFSDLSQLRYLNLSDNALKQLPSGLFDSLFYLKVLDISYNQLLYFKYDDRLFYNLYELNIEYNSISHIDLANFEINSSSFKYVSLDGNNFVCAHLLEIVQYLSEYNVTVRKGNYEHSINVDGNVCYEEAIFSYYYDSSILVTVSTVLVVIIVLLIMPWIIKYLKNIKARRTRQEQIDLL